MDGNDMRNQKQEEIKKEPLGKRILRKTKEGGKKVVDGTKKAVAWCYDNGEEILTFVGGAVGVICLVKKGTDTLGITNKTKYERTVQARKYQYYDPRSRRYFELRRELSYDEELEIEERRQYGEPISKILSDMGVLKRRGW